MGGKGLFISDALTIAVIPFRFNQIYATFLNRFFRQVNGFQPQLMKDKELIRVWGIGRSDRLFLDRVDC